MRAADVMTTNVITVLPSTPVHELAALLSQHGISGAPVVDGANRLVGIVSEADLLHRMETGTDRRPGQRRVHWLDSFSVERDLAREYVKSHSRVVGDVMTRDVVTVGEAAGLDEVAAILETKRIKRVPVVRDGQVIGIISRANLVRALAAAKVTPAAATDTDDRAIRQRLLTELRGQEWAKVWAEDVIVREGVVHLWCSDSQPEEARQALRVAAENTPGVQGVEMHVTRVPMMPVL